ncbi:MAG: iron ABC transporter permease [Acutalibacteraceae bacterium]|nr:iron ABC transporter permease [Acutalibacteraceae bacterium]
MKNKRYAICLLCSILCCGLIAVLGLMLGSRFISPAEIIKIIFAKTDSVNSGIFYYSRLPRVTASLLSGAALAVSGAVLQNVLSNKLASPSIIGVNAGAGFGVTLCCSLGIISGWAVSAFAFGGSLIAVILLSLFASRTNASKTTVILGGVALNSILGAFSESLSVLDNDVAMLTTEFRVGGFSAVSYTRLLPAAVMILTALLILFTLFNELDIVALGDETAKSVGLKAKKFRMLFLALSALLAGAAVSFSGLLGFVGLIVPHFVRKFTGNESRKLLPLSAVAGGGFVCLCDTLSRLLFKPYELPVGILMSLIGGPVFVVMLVRMKGGYKK